ncbi:MAG: TIGR04283 family arsenosugar biosynthesis glycosyltransferase [Nitrospirae bacterium]|nr:TIGR04283 family arsenosugar biosynthesis glycosyltransferase [Nitrospirota bacterium]
MTLQTHKPWPKVSVIVPVRDEETRIEACLRSVHTAACDGPIETIVVDGGSTDRSVDVAIRCGAIVVASPAVGRGVQMHWGARCATGDVLVFLHADTRLPPNWIARVQRAFWDRPMPPAAAAFSLAFDSSRFLYKALSALANLRSRVTGLPHGDQALIISRRTYFAAGGFPDVPLMEEYLLIPKLKRLGPIEQFPERVVTSSRRYERGGAIRTVINKVALVALFYAGVAPARLARWYW